MTPVGYESAAACSSGSAGCFLATPPVPRTIRDSEEDLAAGRDALLSGWSTGSEPGLVITKAAGAQMWDADGRELLAWWPQETTLVAELAAVANEVRRPSGASFT